ncbi:MAG: DUF924 family protein [Betaproteobacteria bacterium]
MSERGNTSDSLQSGTEPPWQSVLDFWFLPPAAPGFGEVRSEWFRKDPTFDEAIREQFGGLIEAALGGALDHWDIKTRGALARIIVLDQFTRNLFRNTARAFAGDAQALSAARALVDTASDRALPPVERWFVYMPFEHAEDIVMQERAITLFTALEADSKLDNLVGYAVRHRDIIARFGRFPHRNRMLDRASTPDEIEFLKQPGSGF